MASTSTRSNHHNNSTQENGERRTDLISSSPHMTANLRCCYCIKRFNTEKQLRQHISATLACRSKWEEELTMPSSSRCDPSSSPVAPGTLNPEAIDDIELHELHVQYMFLSDGPPPSKRARVEDQDTTMATSSARLPKLRYGEIYPYAAGSTYGSESTTFESWIKEGVSKWEPFRSREEWNLAKWLVKHIGHGGMNELLGLDIVSKLIKWVEGNLLMYFR